ncbi:TLC domain-containing protein 4-B [Nothobranchius furzeri]|uniref:TLC domain containing 4a n=1 Tax=Nothobranchius furzeri TaxID=105023 RepID=A0A1A8UQH2_NOTFU|nr:TLC domain-containing protein 4-B [Nothobranchius furzeri]KAF7214070.1 transmembrane protein 56-B-like [Nothobranchius furzeri]
MDPFSQLILAIAVTSFFTFQWLFHRVSPWMSTHISTGFSGLSNKQKVEWNSRTVSTFHALLVGIFCLCILLFDDAVNEDPVWGDPTWVKTNVAITTGYLISDLLLIFYYWKAIGDKFFVVHHLAALYAYYYVLGQGMLPYFANFRLLAEFSTPCVNQRWFFEVLGYPKSSRPNMANGVAMAGVFFMVRIAVMPVYYGRMYAVYGTEAFYLVPWGGRVAWIGSSICLDIMNIMWMHKIARGCYKVLQSARREKGTTPQENGKMD